MLLLWWGLLLVAALLLPVGPLLGLVSTLLLAIPPLLGVAALVVARGLAAGIITEMMRDRHGQDGSCRISMQLKLLWAFVCEF